MSTEAAYELPVPTDLTSILAIHDGGGWIRNVIGDTVTLKDGVLSFTARFGQSRMRFTIATDIVGGYKVAER